jgi:ABC-2 type transport system permease protein
VSAFVALTRSGVRLYLREPAAAFFTVAFAPMLLVLFGFIYGNAPQAAFGGRGTVDVSVPAYLGVIVVTVGLISIPIGSSTERERGVLRRYRATPLRPISYIAADVTRYFLMTALGAALLVAVGKIVYDVRFDGDPLVVLAGFALGSLSFFALGYVLASVAPSARVAQTAGMVLAYPMMFLSGSTIPLENMPESVRRFAEFLPLTHVVTLLRGLWNGDALSMHGADIAILAFVLVVGAAIAARAFRWR